MKRIIVTGANGSGKSHFAARLKSARPEVPLVSFDAIKLTTNWVQRPRADIDADLADTLAQDAWIVEGGPSLLFVALPQADAVVWLDPPFALRAWRLFARPLKTRGTTRTDLPDGNVDHLLQQWRFGWRSLRKDRAFRADIAASLSGVTIPVMTCYTRVDLDSAASLWAQTNPSH